MVMTAAEWRSWAASRAHPIVLDGGLATSLESRGHALSTVLWSSQLLLDRPDALEALARDFISAGADIVSTATYQAHQGAFEANFVVQDDAVALMRSGVSIAQAARDAAARGAARPLVALSLGPYAATLGGGAEYSAGPELAPEADHFHRRRLSIFLSDEGAMTPERLRAYPDLVAFETLPCVAEAVLVVGIMRCAMRMHPAPFWVSFQCRDDGESLASGELLARAVSRVLVENGGGESLVAIGVNCCDPAALRSLVGIVDDGIRAYAASHGGAVPGIRTLAYPNSGEGWSSDGGHGTWFWPAGTVVSPDEWAERVVASGAAIIGGCCRCETEHVASLARLKKQKGHKRERKNTDSVEEDRPFV